MASETTRGSADQVINGVVQTMEPSKLQHISVFFHFCLVKCPTWIIACCLAFGMMIALAEGWSVWTGFLYISGTVCGLANPLTNAQPDTPFGILVDVATALWSLALTGTIIGITGSMVVCDWTVEWLNKFRYGGSFCTFVAYSLIAVPLACFAICFACGFLLAITEGWTMQDGFLYVASGMAALGNPLTSASPTTAVGEVFDIIIGCWSLTFSSTVMGVVGSMAFTEIFLDKCEHLANTLPAISLKKAVVVPVMYEPNEKPPPLPPSPVKAESSKGTENGVVRAELENDENGGKRPSIVPLCVVLVLVVPIAVTILSVVGALILSATEDPIVTVIADPPMNSTLPMNSTNSTLANSTLASGGGASRNLRPKARWINEEVDSWTFWQSFLYVAGNICGLGNPLSNLSPDSTMGIIIDLMVAFSALTVGGLFLGVVADMQFVGWLMNQYNDFAATPSIEALLRCAQRNDPQRAIRRLCGGGGQAPEAESSVDRSLENAKLIFFTSFFAPMFCTVVAFVFAGPLALAESWSYKDSWLWIISNMAGVGNPLTDVSPKTDGGDIWALLIACWSLSVESTVFGMVCALPMVEKVTIYLNEVVPVSKMQARDQLQVLKANFNIQSTANQPADGQLPPIAAGDSDKSGAEELEKLRKERDSLKQRMMQLEDQNKKLQRAQAQAGGTGSVSLEAFELET